MPSDQISISCRLSRLRSKKAIARIRMSISVVSPRLGRHLHSCLGDLELVALIHNSTVDIGKLLVDHFITRFFFALRQMRQLPDL